MPRHLSETLPRHFRDMSHLGPFCAPPPLLFAPTAPSRTSTTRSATTTSPTCLACSSTSTPRRSARMYEAAGKCLGSVSEVSLGGQRAVVRQRRVHATLRDLSYPPLPAHLFLDPPARLLRLGITMLTRHPIGSTSSTLPPSAPGSGPSSHSTEAGPHLSQLHASARRSPTSEPHRQCIHV